MKKFKIAPSILAADPTKLGDELKKIEEAGADYAHIDIMDGHFVPNLAFSPDIVRALRKESKLVFDVHLMIEEPKKYIEVFVNAGADIITIHQEAVEDLGEIADYIHSFGIKAGVSVKPGTPVEVIGDDLEKFDLLLIMTVEPGFGGQSYIEAMNEKIEKARKMIDESGKEIELEIDGGVTPKNISAPIERGIDVAVAGSSVFKADDVFAVIEEMRACAR